MSDVLVKWWLEFSMKWLVNDSNLKNDTILTMQWIEDWCRNSEHQLLETVKGCIQTWCSEVMFWRWCKDKTERVLRFVLVPGEVIVNAEVW